ncbi:flagellar basal body rod protein FlgC [Candidatus Sumerlaeota bacterium]|nr:flagellar basal body rod protein FlgC [Candidatus Sumerlaeota bacterium]
MYDLIPIEIAGSGLNAERARMGVIASNLANANSTRKADGTGPYQRRTISFEAGMTPAFADMLAEMQKKPAELGLEPDRSRWLVEEHLRGVVVSDVGADPSTRQVYMPEHPDADPATGMVTYPDISVMEEMADMISASRNYEANLAVIKNTRDMLMKLLELIKV